MRQKKMLNFILLTIVWNFCEKIKVKRKDVKAFCDLMRIISFLQNLKTERLFRLIG